MTQRVEAKSATDRDATLPLRVLACEPVALPPDLLALTEVLPPAEPRFGERVLVKLGLTGFARRSLMLRRSWILFRRAPQYKAVVTLGDLEGGIFAALQRLRGNRRPVHIMYDCLWYGGGWLHRCGMRFCLRAVDRCIVWASVECERYARAYGLPRAKFVYVPHHYTLHHYQVEVRDLGFIFTGGNADRDYGLFFEAVRDLPVQCVLATNRPQLLAALEVPPNVQIQSLSPADFRQRMAEARLVVMPMRATLLHAGAQQTVLNAMLMGKPVILTDPEGGADYIESGKTGVLVPYGNAGALRKAIEELLAHPEEARAMGERARLAAEPLTTVRCNTTIWEQGLELAHAKPRTTESRSPASGEDKEPVPGPAVR